MINHIVTFTWKDGVTDADVAAVSEQLRSLPDRVEALEGYAFGPDLGLTDGNGDFAVVATVAGVDGLRAYLEHPDHVPVGARLRDMAERRIAVQIDAGRAAR